jgi:hypothetical protein
MHRGCREWLRSWPHRSRRLAVRTHLERVFKKLNCKTRAASTLLASLLGLLAESNGD